DLLERIFRLFDADGNNNLDQNDWLEFLKERLSEDKQIDFVEQVESVAYVLCGNGVITLDTFQLILKNKVVTNKLFRVVDTDGDGYATADEIMEFLSTVTSSRPRVGFDKHSVDRLEKLFRATVGDEKEITREQFQKIVVSKNPFFTERVFQIFDEDDSGAISLQEFIAAVHQFAGQTPEDKIRFLFKVYDLDGDGLIQHRELQHVMRACMEENGMQFSDDQLLELTTAMFDDADTERRGAITYDALKKQLESHDGLLENLSIRPLAGPSETGSRTRLLQAAPVPTEALPVIEALLQEQLRVPHLLGPVYACIIVVNDPVLNKANYTLSEWLLTEKPGLFGLVPGCANPTGIALAVILLVMFICSQPFIRRGGSFEVRSERGKTYISSGILLPSRVTHLVVKRPPLFHFHAGDYVFVNIPAIATYEWHPFTISSAPEQEEYIWLHIRGVGEWTNRLYSYFEREQARLHGEELPAIENGHQKLARSISSQSKKSRKGSVGSTKKRSVDFSPKCFTNEAYVAEEGNGDVKQNEAQSPTKISYHPSLLLAPPRTLEKSRSMPDVQKNLKKRQRLMALRDFMRSESESKLDEGSILSARKTFGLASKIPQNKSLVHSFRYMRTKPTIIAFKTPSFEERRRSNDSILTLARRRLSKSLSPDRDIECQPEKIVECENDGSEATDDFEVNYPIGKPLEIYLDGPYGAASSHIFLAQHAALVAAGIGVTPFASILQAVMYRYWSARQDCPKCGHTWASDMPRHNMNLKKVDFFWINREQRSFEWFVSLLSQLEIEQAELGGAMERFLEMHMYITSALQKSDMKAVGLQLALDLLHEKEKRDLITGLKTRTNAGRPNWDKVFKQLQEQNKGKVTVFYCGPPQLAKILRVKCDQFGFGFRKEVF
ncbi:hypothetical protein HF086_016944, partial [Spodoptera exigua]